MIFVSFYDINNSPFWHCASAVQIVKYSFNVDKRDYCYNKSCNIKQEFLFQPRGIVLDCNMLVWARYFPFWKLPNSFVPPFTHKACLKYHGNITITFLRNPWNTLFFNLGTSLKHSSNIIETLKPYFKISFKYSPNTLKISLKYLKKFVETNFELLLNVLRTSFFK